MGLIHFHEFQPEGIIEVEYDFFALLQKTYDAEPVQQGVSVSRKHSILLIDTGEQRLFIKLPWNDISSELQKLRSGKISVTELVTYFQLLQEMIENINS